MKQKKSKDLQKPTKERAHRYLIELANALDKKEEHNHIDHDDVNYFGIRDIENLFTNISDDDYYKLLRAHSKIIMKIMKSEEIKIKNYQYSNIFTSYTPFN